MTNRTTILDGAVRKERGRFWQLAFRVAAVILALVFMIVLGEIGVRLFVPRFQWEFQDATHDWQLHPRLGWTYKPDLDVTTQDAAGITIRFRTNRDGLTPHNVQREKKPGIVRIMIFGDSSVIGRSIPQDQTLHIHLERELNCAGVPAEVINGGVEGYSTDQSLIRMIEMIPLYKPDIVIYGFHDNDFGGNVSRAAYGVNKPMFALDGENTLREIVPEPNDHIPTFLYGFRKWMQYSALYRALRPRLTVLRAKLGRWEDRNLIGLPPDHYYNPEELERIDWKLFAALLSEMKQTCANENARFLFFNHPSIYEVWDPYIHQIEQPLGLKEGEYDRYVLEKRMGDQAAKVKVAFCPVIRYFTEHQDRGPFHLLPRDYHCNPIGYQLSAEVLSDYLVKHP